MFLNSGHTLAHYTILGPLGAGAMGEVYRAKDTRLGREVAIKVLPSHFALEPERLQRFEREARSLATLNHPAIAQIYGVDQAEGLYFLALELVPGETLEERLQRGPLPIDEAIDVCRQIAEGLEAAHEAGVIHRDLKPANVRITPDGVVKLLDFGLAKASGGVHAAQSSTDSVLSTETGRLLGTPTYMAPEQARGKPIDRRVDIWAFGCVLYECLTAQRAFAGETLTDVLAAVVEREPDWARLPAATPGRVRELLERCLRKDAATRLRDVGDARILLAELGGRLATPVGVADAPSATTAASWLRRLAPWAVAGLALAALARLRTADAPQVAQRPLQVAMDLPGFDSLDDSFALKPSLSHDGRWLAYPAGNRIHVRSLETLDDRGVPGSEQADGLFWSPDANSIGFSKDGQLWAWQRDRSESRRICTLPTQAEFNGALWMPDGQIYFCLFAGDLYAVSAAGGEPRVVLEREPEEVDFHLPARLPNEAEFVAVAHRTTGAQQVFVFDCARRERRPVLEMEELSSATWSPTGHLLLTRNWVVNDVWAVRYDAAQRRAEGSPFLSLPGVVYPSLADDGSMVCVASDRTALYDLLLVARDGSRTVVPGGPFQGLANPALSPDGRRIAFSAVSEENRDLWVLDVERGTRKRLTSERFDDNDPVWSADGTTLFFETAVPGASSIACVDSLGSGQRRLLMDLAGDGTPTPDGRSLLFLKNGMSDLGVYSLDLEAGAEARLLLPASVPLEHLRVSPDGRWLAYSSNETGQQEVFVRRLPAGDLALQISIGGGSHPMWAPDSKSVFYQRDGQLLEVALGTPEDPRPQRAQPVLSAGDQARDASETYGFGVTPDGQRFLLQRRSPADPRRGILYLQGFEPEAP